MRTLPRSVPLALTVAALAGCSSPTQVAPDREPQKPAREALLNASADSTDLARGGNVMGSGN